MYISITKDDYPIALIREKGKGYEVKTLGKNGWAKTKSFKDIKEALLFCGRKMEK